MIDPLHSLAFSIQSNRGVYAVLIGSGISRSAKIPTGWDITLDLVRKLASVSGQDCGLMPDQWYRETYSKEPDYAELLDALAKSPAERQQLLKVYLEATDQEREEGTKQPTVAHRAIANLVSQGFIKVIVTTNFDRLMETALADLGITPTVLSTPDQVHGSLPLIHTHCCVFKVHGDYLDTRISNTPKELDKYPTEFELLLDRIFDEFGLIVCGWSADWDVALKRALTRAPSRRFSTYWACRATPSASALTLIEHRGAQLLQIKDADVFFSTLQQQVQSLEEFSRPHPLSTEAAVASLKRYLSEPKYRIQLEDLIGSEVQRVLDSTNGARFSVQGHMPLNGETMTQRARGFELACHTLITLGFFGGYWAEASHHLAWKRAVARLATWREEAGSTVWLQMQRYGATLLLYSLGIGAVAAGKVDFLSGLVTTVIPSRTSKDRLALEVLPPFCLFDEIRVPKLLQGCENDRAPLNVWMFEVLKPLAKGVIAEETEFAKTFDKLEVLIALAYRRRVEAMFVANWVPLGRFGYLHETREQVLAEIQDSLGKFGDDSPFIKCDLLGSTTFEAEQVLTAFRQFMIQVSQRWY